MTSFAIADPALTTHSDEQVAAAAYNAFVLTFHRDPLDEAAAVQAGLDVIEQMLGVLEGDVVVRYNERCTIARDFRAGRVTTE